MAEAPSVLTQQIETWPIDRLVHYARNPRKNDAAVDRMCASIREFGFKIPVLAGSDGTVVDGHLRLKAAKNLRIAEVPVILCDEWNEAQVKAFRRWSTARSPGLPGTKNCWPSLAGHRFGYGQLTETW